MSLTVLNVAFPFAPVGPDAVGGAEQVLAQLDAALVRAGHRSVVVACAGSSPAGTLVATPHAAGIITDELRRRVHAAHRGAIERALRRWPVDVVHMHGIDFHAYVPPPGPPVLVTLHLPPEWYPPAVFDPGRPNTFLHCVSASQRARCPRGARLLPDVPNGVALDALAGRHAKRGFVIALGRICPEKGFHIALDAANRAGMPLLLAGQTFPYEAHQSYFAREILPRLDANRRFIGPIGPARKRRLLSAARALLLPSLAPETSSLVAMEALACGTPVIAFPAGALPEIVEHGRTGFIVRDEREMAEAIHAAAGIRPEDCRAAARERFSLERTIDRYFDLYRDLARRGSTEVSPAGSRRSRRMPDLEVDEVTTRTELEALAPAWQDLWRRAPAATPFHSPAWLIPWWREIGGGELRVLVAHRGGRMLGLLPIYLQDERGGKLLPLGIAISDYLDGLFEEDDAPAVAGAMLRRLRDRHDWRRCELHPLRAGSPLLETRAPPGCVDEVLGFEPCLVLDTAGARTLREAIPSGMRAKFRQAERRAEQAGRVSFETATAASLAEIIDAFFRLHEARWACREAPGVLADPAVRRFHRAAAPQLLSAGLLRLHALRLDGRIIAVVYALSAKGRTCSYLSGFDPEFGWISPGTLAVGYAVGQAIAEGAREFDFLRGREPFKYRWGARERPCYGRIFQRNE